MPVLAFWKELITVLFHADKTQFWQDQQKSAHRKVHPGAVLRPSSWVLFSISIDVGGFQSKQFPLRNQIWETPLIPFIQGKMHDIKMQTKCEGRRDMDSVQWWAKLYRVFGARTRLEKREQQLRVTCWNRVPISIHGTQKMISPAKVGKGSWSATAWKANRFQPLRRGCCWFYLEMTPVSAWVMNAFLHL